jgi:Bacterial SH3 domain/Outer membrane protein beta-barrel domain
MRRLLLSVLVSLWVGWVSAEEAERNFVQVADPYVELHTGPGRGYPVFYVIGRDDWLEILYRQTDWFKVRTDAGTEGWVTRAELQQTLSPDGQRVDIIEASQDDFIARKWELGMFTGDFGGGYSIGTYGGYHFTENISVETSFSQILGNVSNSYMLAFSIVQEPFPEWVVSPALTLGTGIIDTKPRSTLTLTKDHRDKFSFYGIGARMHLTKRFFVRLDYNNYVVFTSRNNNEEIREWRAGFAFFF